MGEPGGEAAGVAALVPELGFDRLLLFFGSAASSWPRRLSIRARDSSSSSAAVTVEYRAIGELWGL